MGATDQMLARYVAEIEERQSLMDGVIESSKGEDLSPEKTELVREIRDRLAFLNESIKPLEEARRISSESTERVKALANYMQSDEAKPRVVEYRSAGEYALDMWKGSLGNAEAQGRMKSYAAEHRAAAHQTTTDSTGLIPTPILGPVVNFVDESRPLVNALGPRQLPSGSWSRPKITQHTLVTAQSAEKAELNSQKMIITKLPAVPVTYGAYLNVSRQLIDWSDPAAMDIVISDLAGQYAVKTEDVAVDAFVAGATASTTNLATGTNTAAQVAAAIWAAAGQVYAGAKGAGRVIIAAPPQMLGQIGPLFAPVNPQNAQSPGFTANDFTSGAVGTISGLPVYITPAMADNKMLVMSTAAAEVYEDRIGALSVVEPSVLGVQVAYAGNFVPLIIEATGIIAITKTP